MGMRVLVPLLATVLWCAGGCGFTPDTVAPPPAVKVVGPPTPAPLLGAASPGDPYAALGTIVKGSRGVDRLAWPITRLELGAPTMPAYLVPFQDEAECAVGPDPASYYTYHDILPALRATLQFPLTIVAFHMTFFTWEAPKPTLPPSPYVVLEK